MVEGFGKKVATVINTLVPSFFFRLSLFARAFFFSSRVVFFLFSFLSFFFLRWSSDILASLASP